jgi:hypothetical protein
MVPHCGVGPRVATGTVCGWVADTRAEEDFARFIEWVIQGNPGYRNDNFSLDQLNTRKSEALVRTTVGIGAVEEESGACGGSSLTAPSPKVI